MKFFRATLRILLAISLLALLAGLLGSAAPVLDLANLVVVPFGWLGLLSALCLLLMVRRWWKKAAMAAAAIASGAMLIPPASPVVQCPAETARLSVAWLNAQGSSNPAPIIEWLERENPQLVAFGELHRGSEPVREAVRKRYGHVQSCLGGEACSTVIFSRDVPMEKEGLARGNPQNRKALSAVRMSFPLAEGGELGVMAVHLSRALPLGRQAEELAELEGHIQKPADTIVLGDFNASRRMHVLRDFASRNQFGIGKADGPSWPLRWKGRETRPLIQIDHVLAGRNWAIEELRTSPDLGSDHLGLVATLCRLS